MVESNENLGPRARILSLSVKKTKPKKKKKKIIVSKPKKEKQNNRLHNPKIKSQAYLARKSAADSNQLNTAQQIITTEIFKLLNIINYEVEYLDDE